MLNPKCFLRQLTPRLGITPKQMLLKNIPFFPLQFLCDKKKLQIASQFFRTVPAKSIPFCQIHNKRGEVLLGLIFQNINNPASISQT